MKTFAAVITETRAGAISTVQLFGKNAGGVLKKIFKPAITFKPGNIYLGTIVDGSETIDQVTVGCVADDNLAIHCHGNPLIVEMIMTLLSKKGVKLIAGSQLHQKILASDKSLNTIELEAQVTVPQATTIQGTRIVDNQIKAGLNKTASNWLDSSLETIKLQAEEILKQSKIARLIIFGCKVVLVGPPNSGKSTLLNTLAGREKAIVTDIKGTTRDYVTAQCRIDSLLLEVIDTAGLSAKLAFKSSTIDKKSQKKSIQLLAESDLVLLVTDNCADELADQLRGKKVLTVLNKSDLTGEDSNCPDDAIQISAKFATGIDLLLEKIRQVTGVADFDTNSPIAITDRQIGLLSQLRKAKSKPKANKIITELLNAAICV
ncbi:GTPase [Planctomycetota bacterium]